MLTQLQDMVDTTPYLAGGENGLTPQKLIKILIGGINRKQDKENNKKKWRMSYSTLTLWLSSIIPLYTIHNQTMYK